MPQYKYVVKTYTAVTDSEMVPYYAYSKECGGYYDTLEAAEMHAKKLLDLMNYVIKTHSYNVVHAIVIYSEDKHGRRKQVKFYQTEKAV